MAKKILLADDSITIQKIVELILTEHGFEVKTVNNGQEAVTTMLSYMPDIVLADAEMPLLNGYQLCERIKNNSRTKHIPVILLAGAFEPIDTELAKTVNADSTLTKPFEAQELISKINSFLSQTEVILEEPRIEIQESAEIEKAEAVAEEIWEIKEPIQEETVETIEPIQKEIIKKPKVERPSVSEDPAKVEIPSEKIDISSDVIRQAIIDEIRKVIASSEITFVIRSAVKDSVEKMLADKLPFLIEELTKELLKGSLLGISDQIERVIWETLPDLAEMLITKEIEKIKISLS